MCFIWYQMTSSLLAILLLTPEIQAQWFREKLSHTPRLFSSDEYEYFGQSTFAGFESLLDPIMISRVSGTQNNSVVRQYIKKLMHDVGWMVESDAFHDETPLGQKSFENIIATLNPNAPRRLTLACHYDSMYFPNGNFIGATDSAVPCAMMIHLAHTLKKPLNAHKASANQSVTLQFLFFDGEEAFLDWSETDSLYGSRHLAALWERTPYPTGNVDNTNLLHRVDLFILLDLIGAATPVFPNYYEPTSRWYNDLVDIETTLRNGSIWTGDSNKARYFQNISSFYETIDDDHRPFVLKGVDALHVIPTPFPQQWHSVKDDKDGLDFPTIDNLNRILRVFVARYLHLQGVPAA